MTSLLDPAVLLAPTEVSRLSDHDLMGRSKSLAELRRRVDAALADVASEIRHRSTRDLPQPRRGMVARRLRAGRRDPRRHPQPGHRRDRHRFRARRGARIAGTLINTNGTAIPLYLYSENVAEPVNYLLSNNTADSTTGEYLIVGMYAGDWRVTVDQYDFWQPFEQVVSVTQGGAPFPLDIELEPVPLDAPTFANLIANETATVPISGGTTFEAGTASPLTVEAIGGGDTYAFLYTAPDSPVFLGAVTPTGAEAAFNITIPASTPAGDVWLVFVGHDDWFQYLDGETWLAIEVTEPAETAALPPTGVDSAALTGFAVLMLLGGAVVVFRHRRAVESAG